MLLLLYDAKSANCEDEAGVRASVGAPSFQGRYSASQISTLASTAERALREAVYTYRYQSIPSAIFKHPRRAPSLHSRQQLDHLLGALDIVQLLHAIQTLPRKVQRL